MHASKKRKITTNESGAEATTTTTAKTASLLPTSPAFDPTTSSPTNPPQPTSPPSSSPSPSNSTQSASPGPSVPSPTRRRPPNARTVDYGSPHHLLSASLEDRINISNSCTNLGKPTISKFSKEEAQELDHVTRWKYSTQGGFERVPKGQEQFYTPEESECVQQLSVAGKVAEYRELDSARKNVTGLDLEPAARAGLPGNWVDSIFSFIKKKDGIHSRTKDNPIILTPHKRVDGEDWKLGFKDGKEREMWKFSVVRDEDGVLLLIVYWQTEEERQDPERHAGVIASQVFEGTIDENNKEDFIDHEDEKVTKKTFRPLDLLINFSLGFNQGSEPKWKGTDALLEDVRAGRREKLMGFIDGLEKALVSQNFCERFNGVKRDGTRPKFSTPSCPVDFEGLLADFDVATNWEFHGTRDMKQSYRAHHFKKDAGCQRNNPQRTAMYSTLVSKYWNPFMRMLTRADQLGLSRILQGRMIQCLPSSYHNMSRLVDKSTLRRLDHPFGFYPAWSFVLNYPNVVKGLPSAVETSFHTDPLDMDATRCGVLTFSASWDEKGVLTEHDPIGCNLVLEDANVRVATRSGDSVYFGSSFLLHYNTPPEPKDKVARFSLVTFFSQSLGTYLCLKESLNVDKEEEIAASIKTSKRQGNAHENFLERNPGKEVDAKKYLKRKASNIAGDVVEKRVTDFNNRLQRLNFGQDSFQDDAHKKWLMREKHFKFD